MQDESEKSPLLIAILLIALVDDLGRQRLLQAQHLDHGRRALRARATAAATPASPSSTWASTWARSSAQFFCPILADWLGWWAGFSLAGVGMLTSYLLIQFDGGRLAGYGETPAREGGDRALIIYGLAILAIPGVRVPVHEPHELARARAGVGPRRLHPVAVADGQIAVRDLPGRSSGHPRLVVRQGQPRGIPDDGRGDGADRVQRRLLDPVRASRVVADPVRRPQHRPQRVRPVLDLRAADAELQPDRDRDPGAADEHPVGRARQAQSRAVDPGQVRARAGRRRGRIPVPGVRRASSPVPTSRSACGGSPGST